VNRPRDSSGVVLRVLQPFSLCRLYGFRLVDRLPYRCPMRSPRPLVALAALQEIAWRELGRRDEDGDMAGARRMLNRCEVCFRCIADNIGDPHFVSLRKDSGVQS